MAKKLLLIDVDCGVDDAQGLMMALAAPNVELLGITCCHGNTTLENVCKNVLRVLHICDSPEIPVFKGASRPLLGECIHASDYHGKDGLGDVPDPDSPGLDVVQKEHAVIAMLRIANEHPGQVTLVATGPLTNLALAVNMDPTFPQKIKSLFIMGGNMESRGNTTVCGEFNFACDPEAAYIVLNVFDCPTYIATWEFTCHNKVSWAFHDEWIQQETRKAEFMRKISAHSAKYTERCNDKPGHMWTAGFVSCDSYAVAAAIDESFVTEAIECGVSVELSGTLTRGMMVLDPTGKLQKKRKAFVMNKCDLEKFQGLMMLALN
ncbi:inosine-uridine preferring nucleoside hydrolase [Bombina bombina]|uniref:inosine-uridine preferring nucleoside hydrolase n=1 Tax=Bombina bombina TaxID=8345 RepID=UPI00235A8697|nr:inosine-uridine preferring nucleoside hydrolase [Bombina bombina]XP_053563685.1 inosine-uridine preferring nucleoside hydrolase [Bombina bombina]XP_053563686.1 inosine-uridine preferring nucleoside hydrolase [Bombina bombina]XP_053563687.1 inosine-uridine preferring nucleoside hydrolase [Bombina bombina]